MYLHHVTVSAGLELLSPLHIGSGCAKPSDTVTTEVSEQKPDQRDSVEVSLVQRDHNGQPCIVSTTLKGALRARLQDDAIKADAFGVVSDRPSNTAKATGKMGRLWFRTATLEPMDNAEAAGLPYFNRGQHKHVFVKAQTRIARDRGTADRHKLFQAEMVPPGARFTLSLRWLTDRDWTATDSAADADVTKEIEHLGTILAPLVATDGLSLGRGAKQGQGRIRLDLDSLLVRFHSLGAPEADVSPELIGRLRTAIDAAATAGLGAAPEGSLRYRLTLCCHGPFLIQDAAQRRRGHSTAQGGDDRNINRALLVGSPAKPVLWPSSLLGALRERASWLAEIDRLRKRKTEDRTAFAPAQRTMDALKDAPMDDRDLDHALKDAGSVRRRDDAREALSSVERLFGVAGWRGRVVVEALSCTRFDAPIEIQSVTVDRFTGGALESRLFGTQAIPDPEFAVTLRLDAAALEPPDRMLFECVLDEITQKGLFLGHGSSKGYGWFQVAVTERPSAPIEEMPS